MKRVRTRGNVRRHRSSGAGRPDWYVHDWACVYAVITINPETLRPELGYIGQSAGVHRRDLVTGLPLARLAEHRESQWWGDLIVHPDMSAVYILWEGSCNQRALDEMEARFIRRGAPAFDGRAISYRPRYNVTHNEDNPERILPWEAEASALSRGHTPPKASRNSTARRATPPFRSHRMSPTSASPASELPTFLILLAAGLLVIAAYLSVFYSGSW